VRHGRIESLGVSLPRRGLVRWGSHRHAVEAGRRCLAGSRYRPADVRVLVNAGVHRDGHVCEPAIAAYVQHALGINVDFHGRRTLSFDLLNGGVGMLNAAHLLSAQMHAGEIQVGMVVASDANSDRKPDPASTFPASGAALLLDLSPRNGAGFGSFVFDTREERSDLLTAVVSLKEPRGKLLIRRRAELEEAFLEGAAAAAKEALSRDGLRPADVDLVVPSQVSPSFLARLPGAIGFPREKVADYAAGLPDTPTTSVFLAFDRARSEGALVPGRTALLLACGSGVTVGAVTYRF
jgi:3-oxoacyl-[acyl-carrier-protein] synthase III